jgi:pimeloyl-ACP methyl ester carboxylesterase
MCTVAESGEFGSSEGRTVAFSRYGSDDGRRVVFHYGTPGTRGLGPRMCHAVDRHRAQLLVMDRPGYGASTRWPGRHVADVVTDVARLADLHGWDRFAVWGASGGGPHALACVLPVTTVGVFPIVEEAQLAPDELWAALRST